MKNFKDQTQKGITIQVAADTFSILKLIEKEVDRAEHKHPIFVNSMADALLVIGEELGEAQQAYINFAYVGADTELIRKELVETAATIFRLLLNFDDLAKWPEPLPPVLEVEQTSLTEAEVRNLISSLELKDLNAQGRTILNKLHAMLPKEVKQTHLEKCVNHYAQFVQNTEGNSYKGIPTTFEAWYKIFGGNSCLKSDFDEKYTPIDFGSERRYTPADMDEYLTFSQNCADLQYTGLTFDEWYTKYKGGRNNG